MVAGMLIKVEPKKDRYVRDKLLKLEGVGMAIPIFGRYDIVAMIRAFDIDAASKLIEEIRQIDGITATETLIARSID